MSFMMAFGLASVMLCVGMLLRAKIPVFRKMLVPASVIGGMLGILFMNAVAGMGIEIGTDSDMFTQIVNNLFTVSFISISLTGTSGESGNAKGVLKGALGLGLVWCLLYALTPMVATAIVSVVGGSVGMDAIYG
ncbi:MAG: sodium:glutamate symporter, partial [Acetatifactor sp.]|nr:sodium:glutamate symporter [Acetatifactor sp.]